MNHELLTALLSLAGRKHRDKGMPCEDSSCSLSLNGVTVVCLSDGAGASRYTHADLGSKCVVQTVCDLMVRHFDAFYYEPRESLVRSILVAAIQAELTIISKEHSLPGMECMSATMLFCAVKDTRVIFGHIGDGIISQVTGSGLQLITLPQNGDDASSTFFITLPYAQDYMRIIRTTTDDTHAYVLMTDGVSDLVYDHAKMLLKPVIARLVELVLLPTGEKERQLSQTIRSYIIDVSPLSDDASIGILYWKGTKNPDPDSLPTDKAYCPRDTQDEMKKVQLEILPRVRQAKAIVTQGIVVENENAEADIVDRNEPNISEGDADAESSSVAVSSKRQINPALMYLFLGFGIALIFFVLGAIFLNFI